MPGETSRTTAAYDRIAERYADFWSDRHVVERALMLFGSLLAEHDRVLDAGCGPGYDGALLRQRGLFVVGLDLSFGMLHTGRERYPGIYVQGDLRRLPLPAGSMNGVWASASLLHLPHGEFFVALRECTRVLAPGGLIYISLREGAGEHWLADTWGEEAPRFYTYWQEESMDAALAAQGLTAVAGWRDVGEPNTWLNRVLRKAT
jgi:ubiquinone/menaquinone biosynthesis C-methylase UbiE